MKFLYFKIASGLLLGLAAFHSFAQGLQPGFQKEEYREFMYISTRTSVAPDYYKQFPEPHAKMIYRSESIGLENLWDLWLSEDKITVINFRGTTQMQKVGWLIGMQRWFRPKVP